MQSEILPQNFAVSVPKALSETKRPNHLHQRVFNALRLTLDATHCIFRMLFHVRIQYIHEDDIMVPKTITT